MTICGRVTVHHEDSSEFELRIFPLEECAAEILIQSEWCRSIASGIGDPLIAGVLRNLADRLMSRRSFWKDPLEPP